MMDELRNVKIDGEMRGENEETASKKVYIGNMM